MDMSSAKQTVKTGRSFHLQFSIDFLVEAIAEGILKPNRALVRGDGSTMSDHEAMLFLRKMQERGLDWIPCENADEQGKCLGHVEAA